MTNYFVQLTNSFENPKIGAVSEGLCCKIARGFQDHVLDKVGRAQMVQETGKAVIVAAGSHHFIKTMKEEETRLD